VAPGTRTAQPTQRARGCCSFVIAALAVASASRAARVASGVAKVVENSAVAIARWLWRSRAKWLVLYIALIFLFGTIYAGLGPGSFHDANIGIERPIAADATRLIDALGPAIVGRITKPTWTSRDGDQRFERASVHVGALKKEGSGALDLRLDGVSTGTFEGARSMAGFQEWVKVSLDSPLIAVPPGGQPMFAYPATLTNPFGGRPTQLPGAPPVSLLLPAPLGSQPTPVGDSGALQVDGQIANQLARFENALQGDPSQAGGNWWRMVYFSSTTLTTLGLGDVTPVSAGARRLVALEAISGIIVIGLFLNSVAGPLLPRRRD
jgi:hypothetical protein